MVRRAFWRNWNLFRRHRSRPQTVFVCDGDPNKRKMSPQQPLKHRIMVNYHVIINLYKQEPLFAVFSNSSQKNQPYLAY